jgi:hypothetical protein
MPNWCECDLSVSGPKEELKRFRETVRSGWGPLDFNRIVPYPEEFWKADYNSKKVRERLGKWIPDGFNYGGISWCEHNWGCKWNAHEVIAEERKRSLFYGFETPWSPPLPVILKASEMFPGLRFSLRYYERGVGFQGVFAAKGGKVLKDERKGYRGPRGG